MAITHIGDTFIYYKHSHSNAKSIHTQIALKDILLVPSITKNLLSISKLTTDNNLTVEFFGDVCYVKDTLRGQVLLQGLAEKGLYKLLLKPSAQTLSSPFLCQTISNKPLSMLFVCHSSFNCQPTIQSKVSDNKIYYHTAVDSCNLEMNKILLLHKRFGHPNFHTLMHLLK